MTIKLKQVGKNNHRIEWPKKACLSKKGISLRILPRFQGLALDYKARERTTDSVVLWHGFKKAADVLKIWNSTVNSRGQHSIYPLCQVLYSGDNVFLKTRDLFPNSFQTQEDTIT